MAYLGKTFTFEREENFDKFLDSLAVPEDIRNKMNSGKKEIKLVSNGDGSYTLTSVTSVVTFTPGVEFEEKFLDKTSKSVVNVVGDTFTHIQKYNEGTVTFKREFSANGVKVTVTADNFEGEAIRYYSA